MDHIQGREYVKVWNFHISPRMLLKVHCIIPSLLSPNQSGRISGNEISTSLQIKNSKLSSVVLLNERLLFEVWEKDNRSQSILHLGKKACKDENIMN